VARLLLVDPDVVRDVCPDAPDGHRRQFFRAIDLLRPAVSPSPVPVFPAGSLVTR